MTRTRGFFASLSDQRGVALPTALMALVILGALIIAFSVLAASEPTIASNQLRVAQARALAEAGVERAVWALSKGKLNPGTSGSIAYPLPSPVPAPYNGSQLVTVASGTSTMGGFRVTVSPAASGKPNERDVVAVGWVPTDSGSDTRTKGHQRITATAMDFALRPLDMPCALCVRGDIQVGGNSAISAKDDTSCGNKFGTWSTRVLDGSGNEVSGGSTTIASAASHIYGADGNNTPDEGTDMAQQQDQAAFDANKLTNDELNALKALAKQRGTYFQGAVAFNSGHKIPDGLVFIDTVSGNNITPSTPLEDYAQASVQTDAGQGSNNTFRGWLIVNGSLSISGNIKMYGLVYAVNDIQYTGIGTGEVVGQMISANVRDTIATVVDTNTLGNSSITYDCGLARSGGGMLPTGFLIKPGSYKEVADP